MKLKLAIAFLSVVPVIAFGQVNKEVCFEATRVVAEAPEKLCFVSITESIMVDTFDVVSGDVNVPETLRQTYFSRRHEERYRFKAEGQMARDWQTAGCGYGYESHLKIAGEYAYYNISLQDLEVSVLVESVSDTCHETGRKYEVVEYKLVK